MRKTGKKFSAFELILGSVLIVYCAFMVIIFLWALNTSIKSDDNFLADPRIRRRQLHYPGKMIRNCTLLSLKDITYWHPTKERIGIARLPTMDRCGMCIAFVICTVTM